MSAEFFGFGSLVNTATHTYGGRPAILHGWRRTWVATNARDHVFLSVEPSETTQIEGILSDVPDNNWAALDERETGYVRCDVTGQVHGACDAAVYKVPLRTAITNPDATILLSYLDVVIQGYVQMYNTDVAARFFQTTVGWHHPVLNDRSDPVYPRHQILAPDETALVDRLLTCVNSTS